jgi:hypothetical protein
MLYLRFVTSFPSLPKVVLLLVFVTISPPISVLYLVIADSLSNVLPTD